MFNAFYLFGIVLTFIAATVIYYSMRFAAHESDEHLTRKHVVFLWGAAVVLGAIPLVNIVAGSFGLIATAWLWFQFINENDDENSWWNQPFSKKKVKKEKSK